MKKIIMKGPKCSEIVEVPIPKIDDDQILVKVRYTGMCHSEYYPWTVATQGTTFGHETMGFVADVGKMLMDLKLEIV